MPSLDAYKIVDANPLEEKLNLIQQTEQKTGEDLDTQFKSAVEALDNNKLADLLDKQFKDGEKYKSYDAMKSDDSYTFLVQTALSFVASDDRYSNLLRGEDDKRGIDDQYGSRTKNAVKQFQTDVNIEVDGYVGPQTMEKLVAVLRGEKIDTTKAIIEGAEVYEAPQGTEIKNEEGIGDYTIKIGDKELTLKLNKNTRDKLNILSTKYGDYGTHDLSNIFDIPSSDWEVDDTGNITTVLKAKSSFSNLYTLDETKSILDDSNFTILKDARRVFPEMTFTSEELKNTEDEDNYAKDAIAQGLSFMNLRLAQSKGFVNANGTVLQPDFYERVEPDSTINFAVKEKPIDEYLVKCGWHKIDGDIEHYQKDINNDGKLDVVPTKVALFIEKNKIVFDSSVAVSCYDPVPNSVYYSKGGFSSFAIDFDANPTLSLDTIKPYISDKWNHLGLALGKQSIPSYVHMENENIIGLKANTIVTKQVPSSLTFLGAEKCQIPLDSIKNVTHVWDYATNKKIAIPQDRANYVYENGSLIDIRTNPDKTALYKLISEIIAGKDDKGWDQIVQKQRGNVELVSKDGEVGLSSYGYETYVDVVDGGYRLAGAVDKKFTFTDVKELYQTLNLVNRIKHDYLYNDTYKNRPIIFENNDIQIDDGTFYDTTIVSQDALTKKFPTVKKYVNQFVSYLNKQKTAV